MNSIDIDIVSNTDILLLDLRFTICHSIIRPVEIATATAFKTKGPNTFRLMDGCKTLLIY